MIPAMRRAIGGVLATRSLLSIDEMHCRFQNLIATCGETLDRHIIATHKKGELCTENPDVLPEIGLRRKLRHRIVVSLSKCLPSRSILRLAGIGTLLLLLAGPFRAGWMHPETDFPNYYTAAVLVRQHRPLHDFYDWTWFVRQMDYAGNGTRLGSYTAQTPLTMLPMLGLAGFQPQSAKRIWLVCNLLFLGATVWLLTQITKFRFESDLASRILRLFFAADQLRLWTVLRLSIVPSYAGILFSRQEASLAGRNYNWNRFWLKALWRSVLPLFRGQASVESLAWNDGRGSLSSWRSDCVVWAR